MRAASLWDRVGRELGRIRARLLLVNLLVLVVPAAGLEFARIHERQLLAALQTDLENQAALVRAAMETDLARDVPLDDPAHEALLTEAAKRTRTRVRVLDEKGAVVVDSHANGPPEGPEPPPPTMLPSRVESDVKLLRSSATAATWPEVPDRVEVRTALQGKPSAYTRVREKEPEVMLFVAAPILVADHVRGAVYVVRSTQQAMVELYRIRAGLVRVLTVALVLTAFVTLALAWTISRPLERLSRAAKRVAGGQRDVEVPITGSGEIRELAESFAAMKARLDARHRYIKEFAADVAHEFKSPLTAIGGAAELLDEGAADDLEARKRFLGNIRLDVARLDRLVSRLLELSRIEAAQGGFALVDLRALVERVAARADGPDHPIRVRYDATSDHVEARENDLETALSNLLDNAVRFSPANEPVTLAVTTGASSSSIRISVRDAGPGISEANLPKIFDRFFTTDAARDGTGLGLSIVKSVVEAHGGKIAATSTPGEGATFTISLPARA